MLENFRTGGVRIPERVGLVIYSCIETTLILSVASWLLNWHVVRVYGLFFVVLSALRARDLCWKR